MVYRLLSNLPLCVCSSLVSSRSMFVLSLLGPVIQLSKEFSEVRVVHSSAPAVLLNSHYSCMHLLLHALILVHLLHYSKVRQGKIRMIDTC